jgi:transcription-repair coupling factor (superfamily II helicase)
LIKFTAFPQEDEPFFHLNFFSVLPYYTIPDFVVDIKERLRRQYEVVIATKKWPEIEAIFLEYNVLYTRDLTSKNPSTVKVIEFTEGRFLPHSFQNNQEKLLLLTDREIFAFHRSSRQRKAISGMNMELMNSLKPGDFVVHLEHGLAEFGGIVRRDLGEDFGTREYMKLGYAGNDKLYVPVESAEKITKFIGDDAPKLTKLDSSDWQRKQEKIKKETERIAKDLIKLYAARELATGRAFLGDGDKMLDFCASFPYELTPGQGRAWDDVRLDLESKQPMDRLICGDVGFGKTEIAMRAAFKSFCSGQQAAILAPITILAEQHYQSFLKRVAGKNYGARVELLSRFQSKAEQNKILKDIKAGFVDIVIGTHRLLSGDVKFKDLGIIIIDEEQRFGVKQKEKLKELRAGVHTLTLTATPIPRTLNMSLNKLKDISTITTPPPGRLPVVTEVRKFNLNLIREKILEEVKRGGQVYLLHNQVKTIEGFTHQLKTLMPEVRFIIGHGQLKPEELESRINIFKRHEADVLVASTIIENGIDMPNANTLFVNRAEKFGLSQLYQLRGRVGRGRTQAYAYFLYHGQKLALEAKKRLRAIVEASELGSGFQIAMRDLEIRGAGEILGANQAGTMKTVGVGHFMRILAKTVEEIRTGEESVEDQAEENVTVEIPLSAYIPTTYIPNVNEKIRVYQELSASVDEEHLRQIKQELKEDYGKMPFEVDNLCKVIALKLLLREIHVEGLKINRNSHRDYEIVLRMGKKFTPEQIFGLIKNGKNQWTVTAKALKLKMNTLPVTWYKDLRFDIECLRVEKKTVKKSTTGKKKSKNEKNPAKK